MRRVNSGGLAMLVGLEVSAISFVRDYVEVLFDGPILRALSEPYGHWQDAQWRFPEPGAVDVMRRYIGSTVFSVDERPERRLAFESSTATASGVFFIPLDEESRVGPEAAHLVGADAQGRPDLGQMWIW